MDLDLTDEVERGESSLGKDVDGEVSALGFDAEVVPAVSETNGRDDGIQEEMAKTIVCRTWTFASCYTGERQLELAARR
jgi:hypothetical protein